MSRITIVLCAVLLLAMPSCKKLGQFKINYDTTAVYSKGLPINVPLTVFSPEISTNTEQTFSINNTRKDLITSIKLNELVLTATSPPGQTFSFVTSVHVYISSANLPRIEIASKTSVPSDVGNTLTLDVTDAELMEYIKADKFTLTVESTSNKMLTQDVDVKIHSQFLVHANLLKAL